MKALRIIQCRDPLMWYADMIGEIVPFLAIWEGDGYKSMEPAGYVNIVRFEDAEIVEVPA